MSNEHKTFIDAIKEQIGSREPTQEQVAVTEAAQKFYLQLRGGKVQASVSKTMIMYIHAVLPELSLQRAEELTQTVHTLIATVLTYLVEDGLIKGD